MSSRASVSRSTSVFRAAQPQARPYRAGQRRSPAGPQLGAEPAGFAGGDAEQAGHERMGAEAAVANADRVLGAEDRGEQRMAVPGQREARDADPVNVVAGPQRQLLEARHRGQPAPEPAGERPLVLGHDGHSSARSALQAAPSATTPTTFGDPASWRSGESVQMTSSSDTNLIAPPPCSSGAASPSRADAGRPARRRRTGRRACVPTGRGSRCRRRPCRSPGEARAARRRRTAARRDDARCRRVARAAIPRP